MSNKNDLRTLITECEEAVSGIAHLYRSNFHLNPTNISDTDFERIKNQVELLQTLERQMTQGCTPEDELSHEEACKILGLTPNSNLAAQASYARTSLSFHAADQEPIYTTACNLIIKIAEEEGLA